MWRAFADNSANFALDAAFEAPAKGVTALFGPSGCGKTTLLRCIAGLTRLRRRLFRLGERDLAGRQAVSAAAWRAVGYVFQEASLFPHLSVRHNLLYGYRRAGANGSQQKISSTMLSDYSALRACWSVRRGSSRAASVSGWRSAVLCYRNPSCCSWTSRSAGLDRFSKDDILPYFEKLHAALAVPVLYVSHDLAEVEQLADYIVLLEQGRVVAAGPLRDLQCDPGSPLARQPEAAVSLDGKIEAHDAAYGLTRLAVKGGTLLVPELDDVVGTVKRIRVRASDVNLARDAPTGSSIINSLPARVLSSGPNGRHRVNVLIGLGTDGAGARLLSRVTLKSWERLAIAPGGTVQAQIKGVALTSR